MNNQKKKQSINPIAKNTRECRNEVLEVYNLVDFQIASIISEYYLGSYDNKFISNVLYAPTMTSHGRIVILRGILKETKLYNKKLFENLETMTKIRNYFAHGSYVIYSLIGAAINSIYNVKFDLEKVPIFNPRHPPNPEEKFDYKKEYNKFLICAKNVNKALNEISNKIKKR